MNSRNKIVLQVLVIGIIAFSALSVWQFVEIPNHIKLSDEYSLDREYSGQNQIAHDVYGEMSEPFLLQDSLKQRIVEQNGDELTISSFVESRRAATGEVLFSVDNIFKVDANSRMHLDREGQLFGFVPGVEKRDYDFFHPAVFMDDPMVFKGTEVLYGLEVYLFEVTSMNADVSFAFPQFAPHTIHTDTVSRLWVEPITGNVISFDKTWENYLVEDGQRINTVELGGKKTSEFTENIMVQTTIAQIENFHLYNTVIPFFIVLVISVSGLVLIGVFGFRDAKQDAIKLEQKEKIKDELVSMLSHEIKNPLTPIISLANLLLLEKDGTLNEKQRQRIEAILQSSNVIHDLLSDFTEVKKYELEQVKLSKTDVDLKEYLENTLEGVRPFTGEKNIKLTLNLDNTWKITCDQKRITQVLSNLVKNAIDFVPEKKGEITISAEQHTKGTIISVQDNGIGIPENQAEVIFDKFQQLSIPENISHEGTGLGLSVCRGIVEAHGGEIWLDKEYSDGARFKFLIPN